MMALAKNRDLVNGPAGLVLRQLDHQMMHHDRHHAHVEKNHYHRDYVVVAFEHLNLAPLEKHESYGSEHLPQTNEAARAASTPAFSASKLV